jgi:hypothetical protein
MVDRAFAAEQLERIREHLVDRPLGIAGVREVRRGVSVSGDVDSGPVLLGLSPSGTGFAMAGARLAGDARLLGELLDTAELAGFSWQWNGRRRYLLAPFVGDAIVLAMKTACPGTGGSWTSPSSLDLRPGGRRSSSPEGRWTVTRRPSTVDRRLSTVDCRLSTHLASLPRSWRLPRLTGGRRRVR